MSRIAWRRCTGLLILTVAIGGCGKGDTIPLRGTVTLDGRPLANASVSFLAQDPRGRDALGSTDADGVFRLSTFEPGDGALPGRYKVVVQPAAASAVNVVAATPGEILDAPRAGGPSAPSPVTLPPRYSRPDQTILEQEVPASGEVVFALESK